jgi:hypothetical protein
VACSTLLMELGVNHFKFLHGDGRAP